MAKSSGRPTPRNAPASRALAAPAAFPVVGVGASAGGLEAFTALLRALPADTGIALVLVQHMDPTHQSILPQLLSKTTAMPVHEVTNGMVTQPNHVYVIPANRHMTIANGVLKLASRARQSGRVLPIDDFFCALAEDAKGRAIGVVLSGLASDGAHGLEAIKAEGGITFAQDEKSARYTGMPASAIAAGCVDFVLPPEKIAAELAGMSRHPWIRTPHGPAGPTLTSGGGDDALHRICVALRAATGVDFELYKPATVERSVARRLVLQKVDGLDNYLRLLQRDRAELDALCEDILIHVTSFFRDPEAMEALRRLVIPAMLENRAPGQAVRVWVPGCSSGEEAYSLAMLLQESFDDQPNRPGLQVFATDVSERSVEVARTGIYAESAMSQVPEARRSRFFVKVERGYQIAKHIREMCVFARHDLTREPPFSKLDLISCRNVLIYMGAALQHRVLDTFHFALKPGGHLLVGRSESLVGQTALFAVEDRKNKIYSRKQALHAPPPGAVVAPPVQAARPCAASAVPPRAFDLRQETERILLESYVPPALVVDADLYIVHFHGDTSPYLSPAAGEAGFHLLRMARPELLVDLRRSILQARKENATVRKEGIRFQNHGVITTVDLEVAPLRGRHSRESDLLVVFRARQAPVPGEERAGDKGRAARQITRLERELAASREQIRAMVEDYETAKEELQSSNEELTTLNDELQSRNVELGHLTNDLGNLLVGVDIPVVILDAELRIRRFTPSAEQTFGLIPADVGRPFHDLASRLDIRNWDELIAEVVGQRRVVERETRDQQGRWYHLRLRPYASGERKVDGVLMALLDIDSVKRSLDEAIEARNFAEAIVETVREPLLVLDAGLRVMRATRSFYETFQVGQAETEGRVVFDLGNGQWNIPRLRTLLEEILPRGRQVHDFEMGHDFPAIGYRRMILNARQLYRSPSGARTILLAIGDDTERIRAEELRQRILTMQDATSQAILSVGPDGRILMANRMAETMFGYGPEEFLDLPLEALLPERFREDRRTRSLGLGTELKGLRKDGTEFPIANVLNYIHTTDRTLAIDFITDLTDRQRAEEALRESEARFSLFMTHLPAAAFMKDLTGHYVYVNPGFGKLTSRPPENCLGATDADFWPGAAAGLRSQDQSVIQSGRAVTTEDGRTLDGQLRHFQTVRFPIPNQQGQTAMLAGMAVEITERKLVERERQTLQARLVTAQEEERRRISRELHDDLTQRLAGLAMEIGSVIKERPASASALKKRLQSLQQRLVQAAEVTRHIAHQLHPSELDDLGLVAALRSYCEDFAHREGIEVNFASHSVPKELNREIVSSLYQVTRESLTNISKHAGAIQVSVNLDGAADRIRLSIRDGGAGFRVESPAVRFGLGIAGMKERVELLHGRFTVLSQPGIGTEIIAEVPLEAHA